MHIAIIGATAFIVFVMIGGLLMSAVVLEQRTRRRMAATAAAIPSTDETPAVVETASEKLKVMTATAGR
jgi:hypothetical protein